MPTPAAGPCRHIKPDGTRCRAAALPGKRVCVFHDKASAAKTAAGRRQGGEARSKPAATLPPDAVPLLLGSPAEVTAALGETFNLVRTGRLAVPVGNCLAVIGQALLKALERGDLEGRIAALEDRQPATANRRAA